MKYIIDPETIKGLRVQEGLNGDIIWIDLNPQLGHEQKGRRPALVVWGDSALKHILKAMLD